MGLFDTLESQAEAIAGKAGVTPDQVKAIGDTIRAQLGDGSNHVAALESAAAQHGIPVDKIQEILGHAGSSGDLASELGGVAKSLLG